MKNRKLRQEILFGAIGISVFIIIVSMTAVSYVIRDQNAELSSDMLRKSFRVVFDDLSARQENLLAAGRQLAKMPRIGITIKYMVSYGKYQIGNVSLHSTYQKLASQVSEIGQAADMWKIALYDFEGDVMAFAVMTDEGAFAGYAEGFPDHKFQVASSVRGKLVWKQLERFEMIEPSLNETVPREETIRFEQVGPFVCLVAYVPIRDTAQTQNAEQRTLPPLGVAKAIIPLDQAVVNRLSRLTDTQINLFATDGRLSVGTLSGYDRLVQGGEKQESGPGESGDARLFFSEMTHQGSGHVQAAYPLYTNNTRVGTIAALYSKEIAKANTREMIRILAIIAWVCVCVIIPLAFVFSNTISKPIQQVVTALKDGIANGDFTKELHIRQTGEIGELAHAFQTMKNTVSQVSEELTRLMTCVQEGKLDFRANTTAFAGQWRKLVIGVNNLVSAFVAPINVTAEMLDRLAKGEIPEKVVEDYKGDFNKTKNNLNTLIEATHVTTRIAEEIAGGNLNVEVRERSEHDRLMQALNRMIQKLNEIMNETKTMIQAVGRGELDIRGNAEGFDGGWRDLVTDVNHLISGLSDAVSKSATLSHEMDLARRIQTSLLPKKTEHDDLDIEAMMIPAEQVGGDFYDILHGKDGQLWLGIGDVSGHGITSGLIMMMVQTVHATLISHLTYSPREVVVIINNMLYKNVQERLGKTHHMTFTGMKYLGAGRFVHAGLHDDPIVFRKEKKACEFIETDGVFLNFIEDISEMTENSYFTLDIGDTLILYTDGLTEAWSPEGEMLDMERFVKIIEAHVHEDTETLRDSLLNDVLKWCENKRDDDMTLVVVRRVR